MSKGQANATMSGPKHWFPFNAEQTLNVLSEMGPIFTMFVVNFKFGVEAGVWSLVGTTALALVASLIVLRRPPIMPFIAGAVTITFGALTLITGDPKWVQIKVTIFNALVAGLLLYGLMRGKFFFEFVFGKTFHYTAEGWYQLTRNVAIFFLITAIANEVVRLGFAKSQIPCFGACFKVLHDPMLDGLDIWMIFKLFFVMPLTGIYLFWQVRLMQKYRLPDPKPAVTQHAPLT